MMPDEVWQRAGGDDVEEVHALICACDAHTATAQNPAPVRSLDGTRWRVEDGEVYLLRENGELIATFSLTWTPPFDQELSVFPEARRPLYLSRLAVRPDKLKDGSLAGVRCLRRAMEVAAAAGADALRSEANPDLRRVHALLDLLGFEECAARTSESGRPRVYLQKKLAASG